MRPASRQLRRARADAVTANAARCLNFDTFIDPKTLETLSNDFACKGAERVGGRWECPGDGTAKPAKLKFPGVCARCDHEAQRRDFERPLRAALNTIPEQFQWAVPNAPEAEKRIVGYKKHVKAAIVAAAKSEAKNIVLIGDARRGKTSAACMLLAWTIGCGRFEHLTPAELEKYQDYGELPPTVRRARHAMFVAAESLKRDTPESELLARSAIAASALVLDDLGAELDGAPIGSGWIPAKIGLIKSIIEQRANRTGIRTFFTTALHDPPSNGVPEADLYRKRIAAFYGDGIAGRIFENAFVIDIGRWPAGDGR